MLKRDKEIMIWLTENELEKVKKNARRSGLSQQAYLRAAINGMQLKEQPSIDFMAVLKQLRQINNNMNQIALKANAIGFIDAFAYQENVDRLQDITADLLRQVMS